MTLRESQQREDKGRGRGEAQRHTMHYSCENVDRTPDFSLSDLAAHKPKECTRGSLQLTQNIVCPCIKPTSWHVHLGSASLCFQNQHDVCTQCPVKSLIPLLLSFCQDTRVIFFRDALTATGTRVKANKFAVFMKSVVKVCFRLTWLGLERFMALQVVCRHDRVFAPFCPPSSFTALCCRLVWERTFLTPRYINMKNSQRVFLPNTPTPLWLEIIPLFADYLCTCTLKHFKNIAASLLRPIKQSSLSKLDAVVTAAMRAFSPHSQVATVKSFSQWKHFIWLPGEPKVGPIILIWIMFCLK